MTRSPKTHSATHATVLGANRVFQTEDLDEARVYGERLLSAQHELAFASASRSVNSEMRAFALSEELMLLYCRYGGDIQLTVPSLPFTLLQTPIAGDGVMEVNGQCLHQDAQRGSVVTAGSTFRFRFRPTTERLALVIKPAALRRVLSALLGEPASEPVVFDVASPVHAGKTQAPHTLMRMVARQVDAESPLLEMPLARAQVADHLLMQLVCGQTHNYSERLTRPAAAAAPRHVRRVEDYVEANAHTPLRLEDLVDISGVSARALQAGFRRFRDTTPMGFVRDVRLRRARDELQRAEPEQTTVTEVALRWGFPALGRFSRRYMDAFGELPAHTLRASSQSAGSRGFRNREI